MSFLYKYEADAPKTVRSFRHAKAVDQQSCQHRGKEFHRHLVNAATMALGSQLCAPIGELASADNLGNEQSMHARRWADRRGGTSQVCAIEDAYTTPFSLPQIHIEISDYDNKRRAIATNPRKLISHELC